MLLPGEEVAPSRRAFLQLAGFGLTSAALAGCSRAPIQHVLSSRAGTPDTTAGSAYWIATTCHGCSAACGVLAKCRDGRPLKLEGNELHRLSRGGLCAYGQAEVLSLYDSRRVSAPRLDGVAVAWREVDEAMTTRLEATRRSGGRVRLLTGTLHSPSTRSWVRRFLQANPGARHLEYDALSASAIRAAHLRTHGIAALPAYRFEAADVIASIDADFLGTWISPVSFAAGWAAGRQPDGADARMSRHVQLEGRMSLTGAAADRRLRMAPWETRGVISALCEALEVRAGGERRVVGALERCRLSAEVRALAESLWMSRGRSLVVCGANDTEAQVLCNHANALLGSYGATLSVARASQQRRGSDAELEDLAAELEAGAVELLIVSGVNPAYDLPPRIAAAIARAATLVVHSDGLDETAALARLQLPAPHALEQWDDGEPELGRYSLTQPTVPSLHGGRTLRELLARWLGDERADRELLAEVWRDELHATLAPAKGFEAFFRQALHDGYVERAAAVAEPEYDASGVMACPAAAPSSGLELVLYPKIGMLAGGGAHNPWLQELPDPVSKATWGNYACVSPARAERLGVEDGEHLRVEVEDGLALELPVLIQRGQHDDVIAVALGYGRAGTDRFAGVGPDWLEARPTVREGETVGVNVAPFLRLVDGDLRYSRPVLAATPVQGRTELARTQDHHTLEVPKALAIKGHEARDAVLTTSFAAYSASPERALHRHEPAEADLWPADHEKPYHRWGMVIDLGACIGCSACAVSCQAENNVPVVGRDEVARHREMHWLRIDRYLAGEGDEVTAAYQPMLCQQCDNAPCEAVCPVLATVHSSEGLNQQVYNRCVGTRYCANTCPYKVRRFNWFEYSRDDELRNLQLNPDVTVRSRGVMEKCSFCAQRIQEAKSEAVRRGEPLADGDIRVACQQSCPTQAIAFGDLNDPDSAVSRRVARPRAYGVLEELNVKPSVRYLARVRNVEAREHPAAEEHHD